MNRELNEYTDFVNKVTSNPSLDINVLIARLIELNNKNTEVNIAQLMTSSDGLSAEAGEYKEIVKKILYQGKDLNEETILHMRKELGDCIFYWTMACQALNIDPYEAIDMNVQKLEARYPGGKFSITHSENRKVGDI